MGVIFSKSDTELVELCTIWSANRNIDPMTGVEFQLDASGHNLEQTKYEIACTNILNGALPATHKSKKIILR